MQISAGQIANHLQRGLKSLYTLHGDEPLLQQEALDTCLLYTSDAADE